jgi:hypothetical protein
MTEAQMDKLTLGDLKRLAAQMTKAANEIRDAQLLLGGGHGAQRDAATPVVDSGHETAPPVSDDAAAEHRRRQFQPPEPPPGGRHPVLSAAEVNQRNALLGRQRADPGMDDDIRRAMENE